ncbi:MAG TPA: hypothetical protein VGN11_07975 [Candidatus Baltobacteraceae bacterium]|jgi:hypothetical protein|nr:hypothetical protein [Candidatus Baltobacteraceae bacterium]
MLLRTMFLLALVALLSETVVHGAAAVAAAALRHRAVTAAQIQFGTAVAAAQGALSSALAAGHDAQSAPMPAATRACVLLRSSTCMLVAQSAISVLPPAPNASSTCPNTNCTIYAQANDAVNEGRVTVSIATRVTSPTGTLLASRNAQVSFRTFDAPPYATLAGSVDSTLATIAASRTGDDGGTAATASNPGTLVNIEYVDAAAPSATPVPGNVWRPQMQNPAAAAGSWDF